MKLFIREQFPDLAKDPVFVEEMIAHASVMQIEKKSIMIDYGDFIRFVPLVTKGLIKVMRENEQGREILLYFLSAGNACATSFSCCMIRKKSEIKAIAEDDSAIIAIPLESAEKWMGKFQVWRNFVMDMYDRRIFDMIDTIDKLAFSKLDEKLWDYLEERVLIGGKVINDLSHQEIAGDLNASREAVSRLLKKLEQQGKLEIYRNKLVIRD